MPEMPQEIFTSPLRERPGGEEIQMPQMREQEKSARVRWLFCQNFQKELAPYKGGLPFPDFIQPSDQGFGSEDGQGFSSSPSF
jgi:hypothetical protein